MTFLVDNEPTLGSQFLPFLWGIIAIRKKNILFGCGGKNLNNLHIRLKWKQMYGILPQKWKIKNTCITTR
jgi:hypothetical protein